MGTVYNQPGKRAPPPHLAVVLFFGLLSDLSSWELLARFSRSKVSQIPTVSGEESQTTGLEGREEERKEESGVAWGLTGDIQEWLLF